MARVYFSGSVQSFSGRVGDKVYRRRGNKTFAAKRPTPTENEPSPKVRRDRGRLSMASKYGVFVMEDPERQAAYEKKARRKNMHIRQLAVSDFMKPPTVEEIDLSNYSGTVGDVIAVRAWDNVQVTGVRVVLTQTDGEFIEEGDAEEKYWGWVYTVSTAVPSGTSIRVAATATDRPGGADTLEAAVTV